MVTKSNVRTSLARIIELDGTKNEAVYEMAKMLTQLRDHAMHEVLGYESFTELARGELPFSAHMANRYIKLYSLFTEYRYTRTQALALLAEHAPRDIIEALTGSGKKLSAKDIEDYLGALSEGAQLGLHELSKAENREINSVLSHYGMTITQSGRRVRLRSSFMTLIEEHQALLKQLENKNVKKRAA